ncbi:MAG: hypothetical protein ACK551_01190 [Vampirovibrionales bacterium]
MKLFQVLLPFRQQKPEIYHIPPPNSKVRKVLEHCPRGHLSGEGLMHYWVVLSVDRFVKAIPNTARGAREAKLNNEIYDRFVKAGLQKHIPELYSYSSFPADPKRKLPRSLKHNVILLEFESIDGKSLSQLRRKGVYSHEDINTLLNEEIAPMLFEVYKKTGYIFFDRNSGNFMESTNKKGGKVITMVDFTPCFVKDLSKMTLRQIFSKEVMGAKLLKELTTHEKALLKQHENVTWDALQKATEPIEGLDDQTLKAWVDSKIESRIAEHLAHEHHRNQYDWRAVLKKTSIRFGFNRWMVSLLHALKK